MSKTQGAPGAPKAATATTATEEPQGTEEQNDVVDASTTEGTEEQEPQGTDTEGTEETDPDPDAEGSDEENEDEENEGEEEESIESLREALDQQKIHSRKHERLWKNAQKEIKELKTEAAKVTELEAKIKTLEEENGKATASQLRTRLATEAGLPQEAQKLLRGISEEEITEEVTALAALLGASATTTARTPSSVQGKTTTASNMSARQKAIAELDAQMRG